MNDDQVTHAMSIDDAYRVSRVLAQGADGVTELVTIDGAGPFVRKRIPAARARRAVWAALADCRCDRLPRVRATYETPDDFVAVCDYVEGSTLEEAVAARGRLPLDGAARMAADLCAAAAALHAQGVAHCDIAPGNVILADDGAHLIDLGIARVMGAGGEACGAPDPGQSLGTWGFAAPEQYGFAQADARSDVYAIGRVLAFALTGAHPDDEGFAAALADAAVVPPAVRAVIGRACAFEPSARYQTARELAGALAAAMAGADAESAADPARSGAARTAAAERSNRPLPGNPAARQQATRDNAPARSALPRDAASRRNVPAGSRPAASSRPTPRFSRTHVLVALTAAALLAVGVGALWLALNGSAGNAPTLAKGVGETSGNVDAAQDSAVGALLDAAGAGSSSLGQQDQAADARLELAETGWSAKGGYVMYGFALKNPSADVRVDFPMVTVTGRAADGSVLFSDDQALAASFPGTTTYFGGQAGNGTAPATVEFTLHEPEAYNVHVQEGAAPSFAVGNTALVSDGFGGQVCTGEVSVESGAGADGSLIMSGMVAVSVILRNDAGAIAYGASTFIDEPTQGQKASFEIPLSYVPDYAGYEVHAQIW